MSEEIPLNEKLTAIYDVVIYRPFWAAAILALSILTAVLEGIGLSFIIPIIETVETGSEGDPGRLVNAFITFYDFLGIPFTLEYIVVGVTLVLFVRYSTSFAVTWMRASLQTNYVRSLRTEGFERVLEAQISYFDNQGSDEILNAIVTQSRYAGRVIERVVRIVEETLLSLIYVAIAIYLSPLLTAFTVVFLGGVTVLIRYGIESGYEVGSRVAQANVHVQEAVQAGTQGIRDIKIFGLADEMTDQFGAAISQWTRSSIAIKRNQALINRSYQMVTAITVFMLIYVAIRFTSLSVAGLGAFLFAIFRLSPKVSSLNDMVYSLEGDLPHLVRTQAFIEEVSQNAEQDSGTEPIPNSIEEIAFESVTFSYDGEDPVFHDLSFSLDIGDFVAFVGSSGAGKSTIVGLITRLYELDEGQITVNGTPIDQFDLDEWRDRISVVRQQPYIFNDTLYHNLTVGNRNASREEVERICEIAKVTEFLDELPQGYETELGDDGVRLSGGQRQRVAIARALLKDADLLILDEATSDLDSTLEGQVHDAIEMMDRDYAMMVIAHRLSTVKNADQIYTIENGHITEAGQHGELVKQDGKYAELYASQS